MFKTIDLIENTIENIELRKAVCFNSSSNCIDFHNLPLHAQILFLDHLFIHQCEGIFLVWEELRKGCHAALKVALILQRDLLAAAKQQWLLILE
jgi:hypothetical protein